MEPYWQFTHQYPEQTGWNSAPSWLDKLGFSTTVGTPDFLLMRLFNPWICKFRQYHFSAAETSRTANLRCATVDLSVLKGTAAPTRIGAWLVNRTWTCMLVWFNTLQLHSKVNQIHLWHLPQPFNVEPVRWQLTVILHDVHAWQKKLTVFCFHGFTQPP